MNNIHTFIDSLNIVNTEYINFTNFFLNIAIYLNLDFYLKNCIFLDCWSLWIPSAISPKNSFTSRTRHERFYGRWFMLLNDVISTFVQLTTKRQPNPHWSDARFVEIIILRQQNTKCVIVWRHAFTNHHHAIHYYT